uniref:APC family permease n=1 Tax=Janibacter limosus TaxID=53458 RepID=A0AC61U7Z0_9MICO|nr:APC family permease [Janibacter limosus]
MSVDIDSPGGPSRVNEDSELKQGVTGRLLYFYVPGDVLGSGIYVLIGLVAGAVGGAFWAAFAVGVTVATITGLAYAELVTKYPQAAGAALYVNKAFKNKTLTFFITFCMLSASYAAAGSLATGFAQYFGEVWAAAPALVVAPGLHRRPGDHQLRRHHRVDRGQHDHDLHRDRRPDHRARHRRRRHRPGQGRLLPDHRVLHREQPGPRAPRRCGPGVLRDDRLRERRQRRRGDAEPPPRLPARPHRWHGDRRRALRPHRGHRGDHRAHRAAGPVRRRAARGRQGRHPALLRGRPDDRLRDHRHGRDHQHLPGLPRDRVADPLRHGARGRRPGSLRQGEQPSGAPGWPSSSRSS